MINTHLVLFGLAFSLGVSCLIAQESGGDPVLDQLLRAGEFPAALEMAASSNDPAVRDGILAQIALQQSRNGDTLSAWQSARAVGEQDFRTQLLSDMGQTNGGDRGGLGGITQNDFVPLMNLIRNTISSDSWTSTGTGDGTLFAFPAGVWVDASKTMHRVTEIADTGAKIAEAQKWSGSASDAIRNPVRMLSLVQLEREVAACLASGKKIPADLLYLGGMYEIESVVVNEADGDLLISGRAGPWLADKANEAVNAATGRPVLRLDDLVVCLRAARKNGCRFGCAIVPRKENLAALQQFLATTKLNGPAWKDELHRTVGLQDISVFGIDGASHAARVLVDADHHMKLLGMGLVPKVHGLQGYFEETVAAFHGTPQPMDVARWWFTLGDFGLETNPEHNVYRLTGNAVRVLSETEMISAEGERIHTGKSVGPTARFARDFTGQFDAIAAQYPIYDKLRGIFQLAIVCGVIQNEKLDRRAGWNQGCFAMPVDGSGIAVSYHPATLAAPVAVQSVVNFEQLVTRQGNSRFRHTIAGVSGGVECDVAGRLGELKIENDQVQFDGRMSESLNSGNGLLVGDNRIWRDLD